MYIKAILPHLTYCSTVWHFCRASDRRKLERLQERAPRTVFNSRSNSYENLLIRANLSTLYNRRLQDMGILMFKAKNNLLPKYLQDLFNLNGEREKRYHLRNSDFTLPGFNTIKYGKHSLKYRIMCTIGGLGRYISVDISVDSRPIYRPTVGRLSTDISVDYRSTVDRHSTDSPPIYRSTVDRCIGRYVAIVCR